MLDHNTAEQIAVESPGSSTAPGLELPVRTACNYCRSKKIRCDKESLDKGGCSRCQKEKIECNYDVREPIGRPKKRKVGEERSSQSASPTPSSRTSSVQPSRRKLKPTSRKSNEIETTQDQPDRAQMDTVIDTNWSGSTTSYLPLQPAASVSYSSPNASSTVIDSMSTGTSTSSLGRSSSISTDTTIRQSDEAPTLSDLGLAAFLESLDTLEINPEDGLTPNMLQGLHGTLAPGSMANLDPTLFGAIATPSQLSFGSLVDGQSSTSYAVPADLSWADPSWLFNQSSAARNGRTMPAGVDSACGTQMMMMNRDQGRATTAEMSPNDGTKIKKEGPCPKTGKAACCCGEREEPVKMIEATNPASPISANRVHCVPNPTGKGCTCLCDVSVALINVRATLRQARDQTQEQDSEGNAKKAAASTLQLTLSASQAIADQCACSASCPTCRSDPSTSLSASLLVSTALQIYVRAVRTLRQGFGAAHDNNGVSTTNAERGSGSEWDVSIGQYKPKPNNAKRIALFAMKLELRDLRDAIGKVSSAAGSASEGDESILALTSAAPDSDSLGESSKGVNGIMEGVNPIDQVVIRKLHQQLGDLLSTVEAIEQQQDAERNVA